MNYSKVILKAGKEESLQRKHPWIFSGAIQRIEGAPSEGEVVEVYSSSGKYLVTGHYQIGSIAVRVLSFGQTCAVDGEFWEKRIGEAYRFRESLGLVGRERHNAWRLVHGEGDNMPGLVVDIYGATAVMQSHSVGMHQARYDIVAAMKAVLGESLKAVYYKSETTLPFKANIESEDGFIYGTESGNTAMENGLSFTVDFHKGQKTGFFVDQRDNRALLERYSQGRRVLNMFCYTGGFSFYAMRGGALQVHSVDSSSKAVMLARQNVEMNFPDDARHETFTEDAFRFLEKTENVYDLVVLDPPAFAKHRNALHNALQGYRKLNAAALANIRRGGILFTFSCSQVVSRENFRLTVFSAAAQAGRSVRILHQLSQPADHPINIYHPEGEYLKGLVLYVE